MTSKQEALAKLENVRNNYILGVSAMSIFAEPSVREHLRMNHVAFGAYTIPFDQVAGLLASEADRKVALKEFLKMLIRALLKESYEVALDYAKQTNQALVFRSMPWWHFARLIRNCISLDFNFRFKKYDLNLLPVTWNGRTIHAGLDKKPLEMDFLGYDGSWELFQEIEKFALAD